MRCMLKLRKREVESVNYLQTYMYFKWVSNFRVAIQTELGTRDNWSKAKKLLPKPHD